MPELHGSRQTQQSSSIIHSSNYNKKYSNSLAKSTSVFLKLLSVSSLVSMDTGAINIMSDEGNAAAAAPKTGERVLLSEVENTAVGLIGGAAETTVLMPILTAKFCFQEGRPLPKGAILIFEFNLKF